MRAIVTGGAGFIGRAVVKWCLGRDWQTLALDDLSNGRRENLAEFESNPLFEGLTEGDFGDRALLTGIIPGADIVYHLAARINVHESLLNPRDNWHNDAGGTFELLEAVRPHPHIRLVFVSTCMVYDKAAVTGCIGEAHPVLPRSPYAAIKLACEYLALSYHHAYELPITVLRPFNTYGPFQKSCGEGGVIATFLRNYLEGKPLTIYGDGEQTRDFLYVDDCAHLIGLAGITDAAVGRILNGGTGSDVTINRLAEMVARGKVPVEHVPHIHPQAEIAKLCAQSTLAKTLLGWQPQVDLVEGLRRTEQWLEKELGLSKATN
jgi:UDP-glucose 4-epimerase